MSAGWHTVHVRVNDATTGQPTPVRIRFVGPEGEYLAPYGRLADFPTEPGEGMDGNVRLGDKRFAYIDGTCEILLPPDPITVEISKGPEFLPLRREVTLGPGKLTLRLAVERWVDLRREGWFSGDTAAFFLSPHAALAEAAAEDVAVVNLLAGELWHPETKRVTIPNILAFSGQTPALERPGYMVVVNTMNAHDVLGSLGLLNCHRPVFPLTFGGADRFDDWTLADWCDQCHRKRGLVVWRDAPLLCGQVDFSGEGEALADLVLGKVDALETDDVSWCAIAHESWYRLLLCGFRVPLVGGSGKANNRVSVGNVRTYARLRPGEEFSYANWIEAVRAGRTFVTSGPLLSFMVNGQEPGAAVAITPEQRTVHVRAEARANAPFDHLEVIANGEGIAHAKASGNPATAVLEEDLVLPGPGWLAARCWREEGEIGEGYYNCFAAHTSPVYVEAPGRPVPVDPEARARLIERINRIGAWADQTCRFETEAQRQRLAGIFREAQEELARRGTQPMGNGQHSL